MNLDNCPRCGKVFVKNFRDVCPACVKDIDREYQLCADYLRKNRGANITDVSDATKVSIRQITKFIHEGRISMINAPNLAYPCEMCGTLIQEHTKCVNCRAKLVKDVNTMKSNMKEAQQDQNEAGSTSSIYSTYRSIDRSRD